MKESVEENLRVNLILLLPIALGDSIMTLQAIRVYLNFLKHNLERLNILVFPYRARFELLHCILSRLLNGMLFDAFVKFFFAL